MKFKICVYDPAINPGGFDFYEVEGDTKEVAESEAIKEARKQYPNFGELKVWQPWTEILEG